MDRKQKQFIVDAIGNNEQATIKSILSSDLYTREHKQIIKVFQLNDIEAIRLLAFSDEATQQLCLQLKNCDVDIDCKDGAIAFLVSRLKLIDETPFWTFYYKIRDCKKYPIMYTSKPFKEKKEVIQAAFGRVQEQSKFSNNSNYILCRASNEDVQKLVRLSFKNRNNHDEWEAQDQKFRQDFHKRYRNQANYNDGGENRKRNEAAWEWYGLNVKKADFGYWLLFDDIENVELKHEFQMMISIRTEEEMNKCLKNLGRPVDPEKDFLIVMLQKKLAELKDSLKKSVLQQPE